MRARESEEIRALNDIIELVRKPHATSDLVEKLRAIETGKRERLDLGRPVIAELPVTELEKLAAPHRR